MGLLPLKAILPPPAVPQEVRRADDWDAVERELGTPLPGDYKAFIQEYGTGSINRFFVVLNPFSGSKFVSLIERGRLELQGLMVLKRDFPNYYSQPLFPAAGGLLPFANTDNGEVSFWRTAGNPEQWTVTVYEARGPKYYDFPGTMSEFLFAILTGSIHCEVLPPNFTASPPHFYSFSQREPIPK